MGRWKLLLLALLLGGLAEASLGKASLAQVIAPEAAPSETAVPESISPESISPEAVTDAGTDEAMAELEAIAPVEVPASESPDLEPADLETPEAETAEAVDPAEMAETEAAPETATEAAPEPPDSAAETAPAQTERVYLADQQISFVPPPGFTAMSPEEIKLKFPRSMPPNYAYANAARDVSVGITASDIPLDPAQLPEVKAVLEDFLETSVPGFQWLEHDFIKLDGQDWIKLEFISQTDDQRIHNDMYITSLDGNLLGFNFNANLAVDFTLRDLLQDSRNSILLAPNVASEERLIP